MLVYGYPCTGHAGAWLSLHWTGQQAIICAVVRVHSCSFFLFLGSSTRGDVLTLPCVQGSSAWQFVRGEVGAGGRALRGGGGGAGLNVLEGAEVYVMCLQLLRREATVPRRTQQVSI